VEVTVETYALTEHQFDELAQRVSNWGRWGQEDESGTLHFITPDKLTTAASLVRDGIAVSCAVDLNLTPRSDTLRPSFVIPYWFHEPLHSAACEVMTIEPHGAAVTHLDALSHMSYRGKMYNDRPVMPYVSDALALNSVMNCRDGIVSRGILIDLARARGKDWMEPAEIATKRDVEAALSEARVEPQSGDILVFRTGRFKREFALGIPDSSNGLLLAGLSIECASWFHELEVASMVSDVAMDPQPSETENVRIPWHVATLAMMGMIIVDNANLETLAETCGRLNRWEFQLVIAPLRVPTGNSSPVNPIALF
jgi:kynurenine formamidase